MGLSIRTARAFWAALFQKTTGAVFGAFPTPPTIHVGLHAATVLTSQAAAAQNVIETEAAPWIGAEITVGLLLGTEEVHTVQNVSGAGPYTVTLVDNLANLHNAGEDTGFQPNPDGTGFLEPSGGGYARVATAPADWNDPTNANPSVIDNANVIDMGTASANWSQGRPHTHFLFFDAISGGELVTTGKLGTPQPVLNTNPVSFPAGMANMDLI